MQVTKVDSVAIERASDAILSEPKVQDLDYRPANPVQWIVAVDDDDSPQFGYAAYICMLLAEHGAMHDRTAVRISNIKLQKKLGEESRSASLGAIRCIDEGQLDDAPGVGT